MLTCWPTMRAARSARSRTWPAVYLLAGNATLNQKKIIAYTIDGRLVQSNATISVGLSEATADGTFYEPESLAFYRPEGAVQPVLTMLIVSAGKKNRIFSMGAGSYTYSGIWTPTLTNTTNVSASTAYTCQFSRVGDVITFSGRVAIDPTAAATTVLGMSLPVPFDVTSLTQIQGTFTDGAGQSGAIQGDTTNDRMTFTYVATALPNTAFSFSGSYRLS